VVADDPLARGGLTAILGAQPGIEVVAQVAAADRWATIAEAYDPEVAVWDLGGPGSAEAAPDLERLGVPVLVLAPDEDRAAEVLAAGARGALFRDASGPRLRAALAAVALGLTVVDDAFAPPWRRRVVGTVAAESLTPRERQVLDLLALGVSNRTIAERLGIGERTAKFHVNAILSKLGAETRTEAVVMAARLGLIVL
jgi:two-component system, NarL family, nitrate/nitrite response regulator NarL